MPESQPPSILRGPTVAPSTTGLSGDLQRLETAVTSALHESALYDIGSYGWLNENDADPELVGHAMWQTDQPLNNELTAFDDHPVSRPPSQRDKHVLVAGEDFCGMMRMAHLTIGLALLWRKHRPGNLFDEHSYFWLHHTDALLKLAIASDRLRDVLVVACTGATTAAYEKPDRKLRAYVAPFNSIRQLLQVRGPVHPHTDEAIAQLPALAIQIHASIRQRNETVHEIATRMGHMTRERVEALQARYEREQQENELGPRTMPAVRELREALQEYESELNHAVKTIRDWYLMLVKASNYVFQIEYWSRMKIFT